MPLLMGDKEQTRRYLLRVWLAADRAAETAHRAYMAFVRKHWGAPDLST